MNNDCANESNLPLDVEGSGFHCIPQFSGFFFVICDASLDSICAPDANGSGEYSELVIDTKGFTKSVIPLPSTILWNGSPVPSVTFNGVGVFFKIGGTWFVKSIYNRPTND